MGLCYRLSGRQPTGVLWRKAGVSPSKSLGAGIRLPIAPPLPVGAKRRAIAVFKRGFLLALFVNAWG